MKTLLVTDQFIKISDNHILGSTNFTSIIKRLRILGELHLCVLESRDENKNIQIFNDLLDNYVNKENITFIKKSYLWPSKKTIKKLNNKISQVDLVIGYVPALNAEVSQFLAHKAGKKYFALMVACPWDGLWNQDWKRKIAAPYRFLLNRYVLRSADYALYVTKHFLQSRYPTNGISIGLSDVVLQESNNSILDKRIQHIINGENRNIIKLATTAMLNISYKGQRFVIHALQILKERGFSNYHYYLIGGGDGVKLKELAKKLGVENQVHFVGKVTHEEVFNLLDSIDIYIHPSLQEGLPRSVVEAMSRALPCIGANTGAIPELLDTNFVVRRKSVEAIIDKILLLRNNNVLKEQAKRNFEEAKKYECHILDSLRDKFYENIRKDFTIKSEV